MTKADLERYTAQLEQLAARLEGHLESLREEALRGAGGEASGNLSNAPLHPADLGSDQFGQETNLGLLEIEGATLAEVNAALRRARDGTFGRCQRCAEEIARGRLDALPYTRYCVECAHKSHPRGPLVEASGNL
jgi:RNA polymerase-binding transcription factor DksA